MRRAAAPLDEENVKPRLYPKHKKAEYEHARGCILREFGDYDCWNEGEAWQPMETERDDVGWHHLFRHRFLPGSDAHTCRSYRA